MQPWFWRAWAVHHGDLKSRQPPNQRTPASHTTRDGAQPTTAAQRCDDGRWGCRHSTQRRRAWRRQQNEPSSAGDMSRLSRAFWSASSTLLHSASAPQHAPPDEALPSARLRVRCCGLQNGCLRPVNAGNTSFACAAIAVLWPRASSSRSVARSQSKEALPTRMGCLGAPIRLSRLARPLA
jgi:hypothetical protein